MPLQPAGRRRALDRLDAAASVFLRRQAAIRRISSSWRPRYAVMVLEILPFSSDREVRGRLVELLQQKTGQRLAGDLHAWYEWLWSRPAELDPQYAAFKSRLYGVIDPRFSGYFAADRAARSRSSC